MDLKNSNVKYSVGGTQAHLYVSSELQRDSLYNALKGKSRKFTVRTQEEFPANWHYNAVRSGDVLITANPGNYIVERNRKKFEATLSKVQLLVRMDMTLFRFRRCGAYLSLAVLI